MRKMRYAGKKASNRKPARRKAVPMKLVLNWPTSPATNACTPTCNAPGCSRMPDTPSSPESPRLLRPTRSAGQNPHADPELATINKSVRRLNCKKKRMPNYPERRMRRACHRASAGVPVGSSSRHSRPRFPPAAAIPENKKLMSRLYIRV